VHRALRAGGVLAALVDPQCVLGGAALLGQPSVQPGQGRLEVGGLAVLGPRPGQQGGCLLGLAGADQAFGQQLPPQWDATIGTMMATAPLTIRTGLDRLPAPR